MRYTTLSKKYKVEIDKVRVNGYDAYVLHEANQNCRKKRICAA